MKLILYFFSGFLASYIGGAFPGAVNLNVVYTTIQKSAKETVPIILAASLGEILLSLLALHCGMAVDEFVKNNLILKIGIALVLILAGIYLWFKKQNESKTISSSNKGFLKGFLLALFNPPVLVFWLVAFTYLSSVAQIEPMMSIFYLTLLFFLGVFIGKLLVLYCYVKFSVFIADRSQIFTSSLNKVIAVILACIGIVQLFKLIL